MSQFDILKDLVSSFKEKKTDYEAKMNQSQDQSSKDFYEGVSYGYQCAIESMQNQIEVFDTHAD